MPESPKLAIPVVYYKPYTGVGSRETPPEAIDLIERLAKVLSTYQSLLRSGHAPGADQAFYRGHCRSPTEVFPPANIFLPWQGFNGQRADNFDFLCPQDWANHSQAEAEIRSVISYWDKLKPAVRLLYTRNVYQVLGPNLDEPSKTLICWAKPHKSQPNQVQGGTNVAVLIALKYGVPIQNLYFDGPRQKAEDLIARTAWPAEPPPGEPLAVT